MEPLSLLKRLVKWELSFPRSYGANYELANAAIKAGAKSFTHTFNAMKHLSQHDPNIVGAAYLSIIIVRLFVMESMFILRLFAFTES